VKRHISRERSLPAFSVTIGELEVLWSRISALFGENEGIYGSIEIVLPAETLTFNSAQELRESGLLRGRITNFRLWMSLGVKNVSVRIPSAVASRAQVSAEGETEAWCAGAVETVYSFLAAHRVWYHWFAGVPIYGIILIMTFATWVMTAALPDNVRLPGAFVASWLAALLALVFVLVFRSRLLPAAAIQSQSDDSFLRRHLGEISLVIALLSLIVGLLTWLLPRGGH
jgi:hypothetical protein